MLLIPAIDLKDGHCVRLKQGDMDQSTTCGEDPAAMARRLQEEPDPRNGLGRLERLALDAINAGNDAPARIFQAVSAADSVPQFWGDTTLWAVINGLAERRPPLVCITGPAPRLPQWESPHDLNQYRILPSA